MAWAMLTLRSRYLVLVRGCQLGEVVVGVLLKVKAKEICQSLIVYSIIVVRLYTLNDYSDVFFIIE